MELIDEKVMTLQIKVTTFNTPSKWEIKNMSPTEQFWVWANLKKIAEVEMGKMLNAKGDVN